MIIILHIIIALSSLGLATYTFFRPSTTLIRVNIGLIAATLATGTYLIVTLPGAHVLETCALGIGYCVVTVGATIAAARRLASIHE